MKLLNLILLIPIIFSIPGNKSRLFPEFEYYSIDGKLINNSIFYNKHTIVILGHLGCHPLMLLLKDLQDTSLYPGYQTIIVLENTLKQVENFNSNTTSMWAEMRTQYELEPLEGMVIAECETEKIKYIRGDTIVLTQCRKLSKKLNTNDSPTIYVVNSSGRIENTFKGYVQGADIKYRLSKILHLQ